MVTGGGPKIPSWALQSTISGIEGASQRGLWYSGAFAVAEFTSLIPPIPTSIRHLGLAALIKTYGWRLGVGEEGHEAEVHVELLVAMEESQAGVVGEEVDVDLLVSADHHHIFIDS